MQHEDTVGGWVGGGESYRSTGVIPARIDKLSFAQSAGPDRPAAFLKV